MKKKFAKGEKVDISQRELNALFENPSIDISFKYSYIAKTFLMSAFYIPLFPLGSVISLIGLILVYFIEKFNLLYTYKRPEMINSTISKFYTDFFKIMIFTFSVGNWIFLSNSFDKLWSLISIILFGCLVVIPYQVVFRKTCIGKDESELSNKTFCKSYFEFNIDYERANPITKRKGLENYLSKLYNDGYITKEDYEEKMNNLDEGVNVLELYYQKEADLNAKVNNIMAKENKNKKTHA
jgi:hypothetical protein